MDISLVLMTVIAVFAFVTGLGFIFSLLLGPVKENQARFESRIDRIENKLDKLLKQSE